VCATGPMRGGRTAANALFAGRFRPSAIDRVATAFVSQRDGGARIRKLRLGNCWWMRVAKWNATADISIAPQIAAL
jgi:uncharacterized protein (DUF2237 family)